MFVLFERLSFFMTAFTLKFGNEIVLFWWIFVWFIMRRNKKYFQNFLNRNSPKYLSGSGPCHAKPAGRGQMRLVGCQPTPPMNSFHLLLPCGRACLAEVRIRKGTYSFLPWAAPCFWATISLTSWARPIPIYLMVAHYMNVAIYLHRPKGDLYPLWSLCNSIKTRNRKGSISSWMTLPKDFYIQHIFLWVKYQPRAFIATLSAGDAGQWWADLDKKRWADDFPGKQGWAFWARRQQVGPQRPWLRHRAVCQGRFGQNFRLEVEWLGVTYPWYLCPQHRFIRCT